jgi:hypothetical protein
MGSQLTCPVWVTSEVCAFSDGMTGLSFTIFFLAPVFLLAYRLHPVVQARQPGLVIAEIMSNMFKVWGVSIIYGSWHGLWGPFPCWLSTQFNNAVDYPMRAIIIGRAAMLLLQTGAHPTSKLYEQDPWLVKYTAWMAWMTAPNSYKTLLQRVTRQTVATIPRTPNFFERNRATILFFCWWLVGSTIIVITELSKAFEEMKKFNRDGAVCFLPNLPVLGWMQVIWSALCLPLLYGILKHANDKIGYKFEVSTYLVISIVSAVFSAKALIAQDSFGTLNSHIFDKGGLFLPPFVSFVFAIAFTLWFNLTTKKRNLKANPSMEQTTRESQAYVNSPRGFDAFWRADGVELVMSIAEKYYMTEMVFFLQDLDAAGPNMAFPNFEKIYHKFIQNQAPYQLNLPADLIQGFARCMESNSVNAELVSEVRQVVVRLLVDNLGSKILEATETPK